jgi:uncharacterized membrane protein
LSWRVCGTLVTGVGIYVLTGKADLSLTIASLDFILKIVGYYLHDRVWAVIPFGYVATPTVASEGENPPKLTAATVPRAFAAEELVGVPPAPIIARR